MRSSGRLAAALAAALLLTPGTAAAQAQEARYRLVTRNPAVNVFVDEASIVTDGDVRSYWALAVLLEPQTFTTGVRIRYLKVQSRENCRARTSLAVSLNGYSESGERVETEAGEGGWEPIRPGTDGAILFRYVCEGIREASLANLPALSEREAIAATIGSSRQ